MTALKTEEGQVRKWGSGLGIHIPKANAYVKRFSLCIDVY